MNKTTIIAEIGVNHNGSLVLAKKLIDAAVDIGADAVKFQSFRAEEITTKNSKMAEYQRVNTESYKSQYEMLKSLELSKRDHIKIFDYCIKRNIEFISSAFDIHSLDFLVNELNVTRLKIGSGEITNAPLLLEAALLNKPIILSTGMSTLGEVERALSVLAFGYCLEKKEPSLNAFYQCYCTIEGQHKLREKVSLLHCTSDYPTPFSDVNLNALETLKQAFHLPVGFSDHTKGVNISIAAVARGACIIEKHFTIDKNLPGPDHKASLDFNEFKCLVEGIKEVELSLGNFYKIPTDIEKTNRILVRKSLVTKKSIDKGDQFSEENIACKRPGTGISPFYYWDFLGKCAPKDYKKDEIL